MGPPANHPPKQNRRRTGRRSPLHFEPCEPRLLLSAPGFGFTVAQIRKAYGLDQVRFGNATGDGSGQTIAIVDAYNSPNILSDLQAFDAAFGLADPPAFTRVSQTGSTTVFPGARPAGTNWASETALDVEWAHALAPGASILLVEANSSVSADLWVAADNEARNYAGVSVVSMSFTSPEVNTETTFDPDFTTPASHNGVTFLAAAGDTPTVGYPSASPNVLSVGGTSLTLNPDGSYASETTWSSGGGGTSMDEAPSLGQSVALPDYFARATPDVSFDADPTPGIPVYLGGTWLQKGGTSFATPAWAAIIAIANQGRALNGLGSLDGPTDTIPRLYQMPASYFHDITTGANANPAAPGYDLATGLGSPRANLVIASLATPPLVSYNMNTNPGWTLDGTAPNAWQYGVPTGQGTPSHDPTSGHTGMDVIGFNLAGNYQKGMTTPLYATTPALDFTNQTNLILTYWRWLGVGSGSNASIEAFDGTNWTQIWDNGDNGGVFADNTWVFQEIALPTSTYNQAGVKIRWVMGNTSSISATAPGWNIDDVNILATQMPIVSGQVFLDANGDGQLNNAEPGVNNVPVFLDINHNGLFDSGEPTQTTSGNGNYAFNALAPGSYAVLPLPPAGDVTTNTASALATDIGIAATGNVGLFPTVYPVGAYTLSYDSTKNQSVITSASAIYSIAPALLGNANLTFNASTGGSSLTVDFTAGDPIPGGGVYLTGGSNNTLNVKGGGRTFTLAGSQMTSGSDTIHFANVSALTLGSGTFNITAPLVLNTLTIDPNAAVTLPMGGVTPLTLGAISIDPLSVLDVADNGIIINSGNPTALLATLMGYLAAGRDGGDWKGLGIRSSAAHLSYIAHGNTEITGLALAWNPMLPVAVTMLNGAAVGAAAVVVKYTYAGDADLDGKITIDDYLALDDGFLFHAAGYSDGAFDYAPAVDAADYAIIDAAEQAQNHPTAAPNFTPTPSPQTAPPAAPIPAVISITAILAPAPPALSTAPNPVTAPFAAPPTPSPKVITLPTPTFPAPPRPTFAPHAITQFQFLLRASIFTDPETMYPSPNLPSAFLQPNSNPREFRPAPHSAAIRRLPRHS